MIYTTTLQQKINPSLTFKFSLFILAALIVLTGKIAMPPEDRWYLFIKFLSSLKFYF